MTRVYRARTDTTEFQQSETPAEDGGTDLQVVRAGSSTGHAYDTARVVIANFRHGPYEERGYVFPGDDTYVVLDGEMTMDIIGLETLKLEKGDIVSFEKGMRANYKIERSVRWLCVR
jgi:uncharacterized cupin superfamily protein